MPSPILLVVLAVVVVAILFLVVSAFRQPDTFRVERSITVNAPPAAVFAEVSDFHQWNAWSPWAELDPAAAVTFDGPPSGAGAGMAWAGNRKMGQGRMTILESQPDERVRLRLEFIKPFAATNMAEFTFVPQGSQTLVTWVMTGDNNFMFKALHSFMNMDKMVGGDFERGLAKLKAVVESRAH